MRIYTIFVLSSSRQWPCRLRRCVLYTASHLRHIQLSHHEELDAFWREAAFNTLRDSLARSHVGWKASELMCGWLGWMAHFRRGAKSSRSTKAKRPFSGFGYCTLHPVGSMVAWKRRCKYLGHAIYTKESDVVRLKHARYARHPRQQ